MFGHRQVGKTTLIEALPHIYASLDSTVQREAAHENTATFVTELCKEPKRCPAAIDEC